MITRWGFRIVALDCLILGPGQVGWVRSIAFAVAFIVASCAD